MIENAELLTIDELATLAHQSRSTIKRRIKEGVIPVRRLGPRSPRISRQDAERYLRGEPPTDEAATVDADNVHPFPGGQP